MDTGQRAVYPLVKEPSGEEEVGPLVRALALRPREMISLVGAGGKTTLMFRLAKELFLAGKRVVTTTTTKILEPSSEETPCLLIDPDEQRMEQLAREHLKRYRHITIAAEKLGSAKLKGISPDVAMHLWNSQKIDHMIIEADGAAGRPIKAPRENEPVIASGTTLVVAILGVDGVGKDLTEVHAFRPDRVSELTGIPIGGRITAEAMALLMIHPEGLFKGAPASSRVVAFLNKVDTPQGLERAKEIAQKIVERKHRQIERIILGQLKAEAPVAEVMLRLE